MALLWQIGAIAWAWKGGDRGQNGRCLSYNQLVNVQFCKEWLLEENFSENEKNILYGSHWRPYALPEAKPSPKEVY